MPLGRVPIAPLMTFGGSSALPHVHQRLEAVVFLGDPLHVGRLVRSTSAQRLDVVNVPARAGPAGAAGGWAGVLCTKGPYLTAVTRLRRKRRGQRGGSQDQRDVRLHTPPRQFSPHS